MNLKIAAEQLTLFFGVFLLVNLLMFLPGQYSIHFQTDICDNISSQNFSTENLPRNADYYEKSCESILDAWVYTLEPPLTLKFHLIPVAAAFLVTIPFLYYRVLEEEFHSKGVQNWNERKP
ncbi:MAG: hypothetical protein ACI9LV_000035 [Candidatus Nanohaloarchaea archaeon]|jgi:hypothetical protein